MLTPMQRHIAQGRVSLVRHGRTSYCIEAVRRPLGWEPGDSWCCRVVWSDEAEEAGGSEDQAVDGEGCEGAGLELAHEESHGEVGSDARDCDAYYDLMTPSTDSTQTSCRDCCKRSMHKLWEVIPINGGCCQLRWSTKSIRAR